MRATLQDLKFYDKYFYYLRGKHNNITDVTGITVGHTTLIEGVSIRSGVTAVIPPDIQNARYPAAGYSFNGNGEVSGLAYINEEARLISPILLTNTLSLPLVSDSVIKYYNGEPALPVVGECWDGFLNDIYGQHITYDHVVHSIETAKSGYVEQGNVGAGTGMTTFGFKGGIGSSSRVLKINNQFYTVGVLVNNNMGHETGTHRYLRLAGLEVGRLLGDHKITLPDVQQPGQQTNSSIIIIATDIPLLSHQLSRLARHSVLGFGRLGYVSYAGSGDFTLAFSTGNKLNSRTTPGLETIRKINEVAIDDALEALLEAVEEAYLNSMLCAEDMVGFQGHTAKALPIEQLLPYLQK